MRVLNVCEVFQAAGIESFIMNMYRHMDRSQVQFDFFVMSKEKEIYDEEIKSLGGKKYGIKVHEKNTLLRIMKESDLLYRFLLKHPYDIVHIHYTTPLRAFYLNACRKANVPVRIYHSHSAFVDGKGKVKTLIYDILKKQMKKWGTHFFACSHVAADWMFDQSIIKNKQYQVIYNGIDVNKFKFNNEYREEIRKELNLKDEFVIVHTGRFLEQKNHRFLIHLFHEYHKQDFNSKLLLLGIGELQDEMRQLVKTLQLEDSVIFLNVRKDVYKVLSAADCYIMPSLYEGLPVAGVEAQCSDLPCIFSSEITKEVQLIDEVSFIDLKEEQEVWLKAIKKYKNHIRKDVSSKIIEGGYDIQKGAYDLQNFYLNAK